MIKRLLTIALLGCSTVFAQTGNKILFDARKAQMAGNADWVIDADLFNIGAGTGGAMTTGRGTEANPQRIPTPAQSGITSTTAETYWKGALSAWAVAMVKQGFVVETLPYNGSITYGNTANAQDLANYKVYVIDEPNIVFTAAEKAAIVNFVKNGGGLFMIADHTVSDRNNDGWDSPAIWNDLMSNNSVQANPFGITFDLANFSQTTSNFRVSATNTILHGVAGNPTLMQFANGTSMTLNTTANPNVMGLVYKTGSSNTGTTGVMFATSKYGTGKVAAIGDSSPMDDGTGDTGDALYNGWTGDASGNHAKIMVNATIWLSNSVARMGSDEGNELAINLWPNPVQDQLNLSFNANEESAYTINIIDLTGKVVVSKQITALAGANTAEVETSGLAKGIYLVRMTNEATTAVARIIVQ